MTSDKLRENLDKARQKVAEYQAKARDLERKITAQENVEIVQAVRSVTASPEELREILRQIQAMKEPQIQQPEQNSNPVKEERKQHETETEDQQDA